MKEKRHFATFCVLCASLAMMISQAVVAARCPAEQLAAGAELGSGLFLCHQVFLRLPQKDPNGEQHAICLAASESKFAGQFDQATDSLSDCVLQLRGQAVARMWGSLFHTVTDPLLGAWMQPVNVPMRNGRFSPASRNRRFSTIDRVLGVAVRRALQAESRFVNGDIDEAAKNDQRSRLARNLQRNLRNLTARRPDYSNGPGAAHLAVLANAAVDEIVRLARAPTALSLTVPEATGGLNRTEAGDGTQALIGLPTPFAQAGDQVAVTWGNEPPLVQVIAVEDIAAALATVNIPAATINAAGSGEIEVSAALTDVAGGMLAVVNPAVKVTVDTAPRFTSTPVGNATQGAAYLYAITAADPDPASALTITAPILPGWLTLTATGNGTASLSGTPGSADVGTHTVVLQVSDGANSDEQSFTITVDNVNDIPRFTGGPDQTVLEDAGPQSVNAWATGISAGPPNEASQTLTFLVTGNTNPALFAAAPAVAPDGRLTYTSAPNANGSATITLELKDNGGTANGGRDTTDPQSFVVTVNPVNDAPSFTKGADQTVNEDAGSQTVAWATALSAGPADEASQTLAFQVTGNTNPGLFSVAPTLSSVGVLSYTPAPNVSGSATITLALKDNGGTANGGQDASAPQSFTITVNPLDDPPVITSNGGGTAASVSVAENTAAVTTVTSTDIDGGTPVYSIAGGADADRFVIDGSTGTLAFATAPDFEVPADAGADNVYDVAVQVSDGNGGADTQAITVIVSNVNEPPVITSNGGGEFASIPVAENTSLVTTITTSDPDLPPQTLTYRIVGGADATLFFIDSSTGELSIDVCGDGCEPDFENPRDADGNNIYEVIVQVSDGNGGTDTQAISATVTNADENEPPVFDSIPVTSASFFDGYTYEIVTRDPDGDARTITAVSALPAWLTLTDRGNGTAILTGTPPCSSAFTVDVVLRVSDGALSADQPFTINVSDCVE
jgi:hypothetical protein